jgi:hypothetical protein
MVPAASWSVWERAVSTTAFHAHLYISRPVNSALQFDIRRHMLPAPLFRDTLTAPSMLLPMPVYWLVLSVAETLSLLLTFTVVRSERRRQRRRPGLQCCCRAGCTCVSRARNQEPYWEAASRQRPAKTIFVRNDWRLSKSLSN